MTAIAPVAEAQSWGSEAYLGRRLYCAMPINPVTKPATEQM
jgi:hypothetical protein